MISIIVSWIIIVILSYSYGKALIPFFYGNQEEIKEIAKWDIFITCGFMFITWYAQIFSLFYKVGAIAFFILLIGFVCIWDFYKKKEAEILIKKPSMDRGKMILLILVFIMTLLWTNIIPQHYDTYLYHAQAIHWIEEYGVTPGLGNLHFRYAYNSAFLSLQALFSFSWIARKSLHTVNGLVTLVYISYAIFSYQPKKWLVSNLIKTVTVIYAIFSCYNISSPNTDTLAIFLVIYICTKWSEYAEQEIESIYPYAFLCLLSIYAITLKLSVIIFVLLTIYPAIIFIKKKQYKTIGIYLGVGFLDIVPFLARNVILSGYLIYPYPEIDIFNVDWKMRMGKLLEDRKEIMAWGRGIKDVSMYEVDITVWFPTWFSNLHFIWKAMFILTLIIFVVTIAYCIKNIRKRKKWEIITLAAVCMIGFLYWLLSAPLPRYGAAYMLLFSAVMIGILFSNKQRKILNRILEFLMLASIVFGIGFWVYYGEIAEKGKFTLFIQNDYQNKQTRSVEIDNIQFAVPIEGDQTGYIPFPALLYEGYFKDIELRGELKDGFRLKTCVK